MSFGKRVLIPRHSPGDPKQGSDPMLRFFNKAFEQGYREMRRVGTSDSLPYAVVLAMLELKPHNLSRNLDAVIRSSLRDEIFTTFLDSPEGARNRVHMEGFASAFVEKCTEFFQDKRIEKKTDAVLSNIVKLGTVLGVGVDLLVEDCLQKIGEFRVSVGIGIVRQTCFILYKTFTKESFVILPCGHLQLRFAVSFSYQQAVQARAMAPYEIVQTEVCKVCHAQYSPDIFPMFVSSFLTLSPQLDPLEPRKFVCCACHMKIERGNISTICMCFYTICMNCMVIARADKTPTYCPGCLMEVSFTGGIERIARGNENLAEFLPKDWSLGKIQG